MTTKTTLIKAAGLTFLLYIALTIVGSMILTGIWQADIDVSGMTNQALLQLAETSPFIKTGSAIMGATSALLCAFLLSLRNAAAGYGPALAFGSMLAVYGALSIVLHPEHALISQAAKLLTPVPLCLLGCWLARRVHTIRSSSESLTLRAS